MVRVISMWQTRICPKCHVALLREHPENYKYVKYPICAYCELKPKFIDSNAVEGVPKNKSCESEK